MPVGVCGSVFEHPTSNFKFPPFSTRNMRGNRIRHNSPDINHIIFSNRNKMRGVAGEKSALSCSEGNRRAASPTPLRNEELATILPGFARPDAGLPASSFKPPASRILIATPVNRNVLNSRNINESCRPNRNKMRGVSD